MSVLEILIRVERNAKPPIALIVERMGHQSLLVVLSTRIK